MAECILASIPLHNEATNIPIIEASFLASKVQNDVAHISPHSVFFALNCNFFQMYSQLCQTKYYCQGRCLLIDSVRRDVLYHRLDMSFILHAHFHNNVEFVIL